MNKQLEEYVKQNREALDLFDPPMRVWEQIENKLAHKPRMVKLSLVLKIAALFLVISTAGWWFWNNRQQNELANINPELAKQQVYFASLIEFKREELGQIREKDPALYQQFAGEIQKMDANYQQLKKSLAQSPNPEETLKAMIWNLQIQITVLNQQLQIIQQINHSKKNNRDEKQVI